MNPLKRLGAWGKYVLGWLPAADAKGTSHARPILVGNRVMANAVSAVLVATGVYLILFQGPFLNQIFGFRQCIAASQSGFSITPVTGPSACPAPGAYWVWNPVGGVLLFEGVLVSTFGWLRQKEFAKVHPVVVSYATLGLFTWSAGLILAVFRIGSLSGEPGLDSFFTGYLPVYVTLYLGGASVSCLLYRRAKRYSSIAEMQATLWLWLLADVFIFLGVTGLTGVPFQGWHPPAISILTITQALVFSVSMAIPMLLLVGGRGELRRLQEEVNVAPEINFCANCGANMGPKAAQCSSCGFAPYATSIAAAVKKFSPIPYALWWAPYAIYFYTIYQLPNPTYAFLGTALIFLWLGVGVVYLVKVTKEQTVPLSLKEGTLEELRRQHIIRYVDSKGKERSIPFTKADRVRSKPIILLRAPRLARYELKFRGQTEFDSALRLFFSRP